ncbi:hypothetical protein IFM89_019986 [Coptis chinensis]|uniref:EamA domain-containing protein n=1 Tax=Coptis chinensis TaxID=261450 RepID=A0A835M476_9MAGN|nr:hypothetical protein IFM89_019986 [Coptis chinensis]
MGSSKSEERRGDDDDDDHLVIEMISQTNNDETVVLSSSSDDDKEITPLLVVSSELVVPRPRINIFSLPYTRRNPREEMKKVAETDVSLFYPFVLWMWSGSKYSGFLCVAVSASIYCIMHVLSETFSAQSIPSFESVFTRCTIILILSFIWLKRVGQPIFGPTHARSLLFLRALMGFLSMFSFIYSVRSLPLSQAIVLNFTTPIMASIAARILLQEKLKLTDVGGLACSFFGLLFIFRPMLITQGRSTEIGDASVKYVARINHPVFSVCVGLFSSITGGISDCLIRSAAKASDQPVTTVFSFSVLACPAAAICTYAFQDFVLPNFYSFFLMIVLGVLSFFAEVFLARGLQLEKTSRVANIQYIEVALLQVWSISIARAAPSFGRLAGCLLIFVSVSGTMYFGREKEVE